MTTIADTVVRRLRDWGVHRVFGYTGDGIDPLMAAFRRADGDPELVTARHEEMAAFMASGHARFTGGVGVCLATQGPGAIHLLAGLYDAKLDRRPVVAIVGQVVTSALGSGYQQEVDLSTLFKDVCGQYLQTVTSPEQLPMVLDNAVRTAIATFSPTCVILPHDVQQEEALDDLPHAHGVVPSAAVLARPTVVPHDDQLRRAAELLDAGDRVALLVGQGAWQAVEEVLAVIDRLGAGVTTSLLAKSVLDEDLPVHCGVMGHLGTTASADLMARCDTLLIVGSSDPWTEFYPPPGNVRTVQVDVAGRNVGAKYPVDVPLVGDAGATLRALLPLLSRERDGSWREQVERSVGRWREIAAERVAEPSVADGPVVNPQLVVAAASRHLPADVRVAVDVGSVTYWYARFLQLPAGTQSHVSGTLACMGCGVPYGLAAKLDAPDRPVLVMAGDGAFQMSGLAELVTVAHRWRDWNDPRFVVLVLHNQDLAEVSWEQREMEGDPRYPVSQEVPPLPYADYAELLGLRGIRVDSPEQVDAAWQEAFAADRPCLIEAVVDPDVPLLPPHLPDAKAETMLTGLGQEPGGDAAAERVQAQRAQEE
jgi:pyruvate dehydrogenase (quinone)